ncbi:hypothetical protein BC827DRAFT_1195074 [Russula dissimulans]|nr:hypothetical protein BC827DRAFT_1195074 [Russula dissimulans]
MLIHCLHIRWVTHPPTNDISSKTHFVASTHRSSLPHSGSTIILQPSITSLTLPSPDRNSSKIAVPLSAPAEALGHSALGQLSSSISNKRKRDSEPHNVNASQLREAQEKVEQKRAKVAARVPSAMAPGSAGPTQATVTSLADLYAQMRRDSGGQPGQQDASSVLPSARTLSGHERGPASVRRVQNAPRGHSSGSSPDPIAISGDDSEIVMLKHVRPSPTQVRDRLKPMNRLAPPIRSEPPSKVESRTATPKSIMGNGIDKGVPGVASKPKHSFAVVVPSPPKLPTFKPARLKQHLSVSDSSQSQDGSPECSETNL